MFASCTDTTRWTLVAVTGIVAAAVAFWMTREQAKGDVIALAMILGGALGNIVDRVRFGYVVDFADLHFGTFRPFMIRSEEHTSELQSLMRISYAVFCLKKKKSH